MKKVLCAVLTIVIIMVSAVSVFAAGLNSYEKQILDVLRGGVNLQGKTYFLPQEYLNQAENYLNSSVDVTQDQAQEILGYIEEARQLALADGNIDIRNLKSANNQKIFELAQKAAAVLGLKLTITGTKEVIITDMSGNIVFTGDRTIKTTGMQVDLTNVLLIGGAIVALIAMAGFATQKFKLIKE